MKREIKYRAYIPNLKWIVPVVEMHFHLFNVEVDLSYGQGDTSDYNFDEVILMQFIGLKDRENKEIFEGDIVEIQTDTREGFYKKDRFEIVWDNENSQFALKKMDTLYLLGFNTNLQESIVVGNVYENPELLNF